MLAAVLCIVGVIILLVGFGYGIALTRTLSVIVREVQGPKRVEDAAIPIDELMALQGAGAELEALGFRRCAVMEEEIFVDGGGAPESGLLYVSRDGRSFASLSMVSTPNRWQAFHVGFASFAADGAVLETISLMEHMLPPPISRHHRVDAGTISWKEQWERHQAELSAHPSFVSTLIEADAAISRVRKLRTDTFQAQLANGDYLPRSARGDAGYRFGFRWALRLVLRSTQGDGRRLQAFAQAEKQRLKQAKRSGVDPRAGQPRARRDLTPELVAHRRRDGIEQQRHSGWFKKLAFFAVSVGLFAVAFGIQMSLTTVVILIGVLLFHELGHALAMRAFGYRNLQILFIPFLGAVAAGKKPNAKPMEEILVLLAGPVPGIVVGTGVLMMGWGESIEWVGHAAYMMLFLNYLNLLPVVPLDGGRVMNIVLFDRFPNLQLSFSALSAGAMALGGRMLDDNIVFGLGIALLVGIPAQLRQNRLLGAARRSLASGGEADELGAELDDERPLRAIYRKLLEPQFDKWNSETRYQFTSQIVERVRRRPAGWGVAMAGIAAYLLSVTVPIGALSYGSVVEVVAMLEEAEAEREALLAEWDAKIEAAAGDPERAIALYEAGRQFFDLGYHEDASSHLERALVLLEGGEQPAAQASVHLLLGQLYPVWFEDEDEDAVMQGRLDHLARALALREEVHGRNSIEVAEVLQIQWDEPADPAQALSRQQRLVEIYERAVAEDPGRSSDLVLALGSAGRLHLERGDHAAAEVQLVRAVELSAAGVDFDVHDGALDELSQLHLAQERYAEAAVLLERRSALLAENADSELAEYVQSDIEADRAWLAYWRGDFAAARAGFAQLGEGAEDDAEGFFGSEMILLPHLMGEATAAERGGDRDQALALLDRMSGVVDQELGQPLPDYLSAISNAQEQLPAVFTDTEARRRQAEQARVLTPLLASVN